MSRTYGCRSDDTTTNTIIGPWPKVAWCQVHFWTILCLNMMFVMNNPWLAQKSNNQAPLGFRSGRWLLPVTPSKFLHHRPCEHLSPPEELSSPQLEPSPGPHPRTSRRPGILSCWSVHRYRQQSEPSPKWLTVTWRRTSHSTGKIPTLKHSVGGLWVSPHPPSTSKLEQLRKKRVQTFSRILVLESTLCMEVRQTISRAYLFTFLTNSSSFPTAHPILHLTPFCFPADG